MSTGKVLDIRSPGYKEGETPAPECHDFSRSQNHGTFNGTDLSGWVWDEKKQGWTFAFNGTDDYIQNSNVNINLQKNFAILAWAYLPSEYYADGNNYYVLEVNDAANNNRIVIYKRSTSKWRGFFIGSSSVEVAEYDDSSYAGEWTLFGAIKDGSDLSLVLGGQVVATGNSAVDMDTNLTELSIGSDDSGNFNWTGSIDDITIWNYALTASEIYAQYHSDKRSRL